MAQLDPKHVGNAKRFLGSLKILEEQWKSAKTDRERERHAHTMIKCVELYATAEWMVDVCTFLVANAESETED